MSIFLKSVRSLFKPFKIPSGLSRVANYCVWRVDKPPEEVDWTPGFFENTYDAN
jgi:hypothetical protein